MTGMDHLRLHADPDAARAQAASLFRSLAARLGERLPPSVRISHVGSTACAGLETKGDLDILVRVPPPDFAAAEKALAETCPRNTGSVRTADFAAFEMPGETMPVGVQLTAIGGAFDHFHLFMAALSAHPALVDGFNEVKRLFDGQSMHEYRAAKALFINAVLDGIARGEISLD